jgi:hypothetical protein
VFALLTLSVGGSLFGAMFHVSNHVVIGAFAIASAIAAVAARDLSSGRGDPDRHGCRGCWHRLDA